MAESNTPSSGAPESTVAGRARRVVIDMQPKGTRMPSASGCATHGPGEGATATPPSPAPAPIEVEISDTQGHLTVDPGALSALSRRVLEGEGIARASISIALVGDATIHEVNRRHLGHDCPTDVISFRLSDPDEP